MYSYIHSGGRIGVILEMNCETDFVARGDDFLEIAKRIAMHIAWANPLYASREEVSREVLEKEEEILRGQLTPQQEKMADKIISGKMEKFFQENCLLEQLDVQEEGKKTIGTLVEELSAKIGEKVVLRRFARFEVGEGVEKEEVDYAAEVAAAAASIS